MYYIIGIIIALIVIMKVFEFVTDCVAAFAEAIGPMTLVITLILCVIAFFAFSWVGVLCVAACGLGVSFVLRKMGQALKEHDAKRKETAQINQRTSYQNIKHKNQLALQEELDKNCKWLGEMTPEKWEKKLPNFVNKAYETSFGDITMNFAKQMEEQYILQNNDWFDRYLDYIARSDGGYTVTQLLNMNHICPQLQITHFTPTEKMLTQKLEQATKSISEDVPASLRKEAGNTYWATPFAKKRFGVLETTSHDEVYDLSDL